MMDENKKAAQKKKVSHFITIAVLVILFLAFYLPVYHGNFQCV